MPNAQEYRTELLARHHALLAECVEAGRSEDETLTLLTLDLSNLERAVLLSMFHEDDAKEATG